MMATFKVIFQILSSPGVLQIFSMTESLEFHLVFTGGATSSVFIQFVSCTDGTVYNFIQQHFMLFQRVVSEYGIFYIPVLES